MPPKRDKRKAGAASSNGAGSGSTVASRRTTRHNNASGAGTNGGTSTPSKRLATTPKPEQTSGRSTNNSRGKRSLRRLAANRTPTPTVKRATGKRVGTRGKKEKELTSFKGDNGVVYNAGGKRKHIRVCVLCVFACDRLQQVVMRSTRVVINLPLRDVNSQITFSTLSLFLHQILPT